MSKLHALLAITGAIDDIVSKSQDPEVLAAAERIELAYKSSVRTDLVL